MGTDFFDDDLSTGGEKRGGDDPDKKPGLERAPSEAAGAGRLVKHKEDLSAKVSDSLNEIDRLRRRQEELEREKSGLESLTRKQEEYERGKQDIIEKLDRSLILIEKEEIQAAQMAEILSTTLARFKEALNELRQIDEERWSDEGFTAELNRSLTLVDDARELYKKGLAKIEASRWHDAAGRKGETAGLDRAVSGHGVSGTFGYWLKVGMAVTLPLTIVLATLFVIYLFATRPL